MAFEGEGGYMRIVPTLAVRDFYMPMIKLESKLRGVTVVDSWADVDVWHRVDHQ